MESHNIHTLQFTPLARRQIFIGGASLQYAVLALNPVRVTDNTVVKIRVGLLAALHIGSFLNWASLIRYASHCGFLVGSLEKYIEESTRALESGGLGAGADVKNIQSQNKHVLDCKRMLHMMSIHFFLGFRCIFLAIPFSFYALGPEALLASMCCIVLFLSYFDFPSDHMRARQPEP